MKTRTDRRDALTLGRSSLGRNGFFAGREAYFEITAAATCGMEITFIDGVSPAEIPRKAMPPLKGKAADRGLKPGTIGAWRTHANILQE